MNEDNEVLDAITAKIIEGGPIYEIDHLAADILAIVKNGNSFIAMSEFAKREEDWARDVDDANDNASACETSLRYCQEILKKIRLAVAEEKWDTVRELLEGAE